MDEPPPAPLPPLALDPQNLPSSTPRARLPYDFNEFDPRNPVVKVHNLGADSSTSSSSIPASKPLPRALLRDNAKSSTILTVLTALFTLSSVMFFAWQILIAQCRLTALCTTIDASTSTTSVYPFQTLAFRLPAALSWSGLLASSIAALFAALVSRTVLLYPVGSARMVMRATILRATASVVLLRHYLFLGALLALLIPITGLASGWATAASVALGATLTVTSAHIALSLVTRANLRVAAAAIRGGTRAIPLGLRAAIVHAFATAVPAGVAPPAAYLLFADVRALPGLVLGTSVVASFLRVAAGLLSAGSRAAEEWLPPTLHRVARSPALALLSRGPAIMGALAADGVDTSVLAVVAAVMLGSGLPFFYRDAFALCVFNHLTIDDACGPFGYPDQLSYATFICRHRNIFRDYAYLDMGQSTSIFIALPFVMVAVSLLVLTLLYVALRFRQAAKVRRMRHEQSSSGLSSYRVESPTSAQDFAFVPRDLDWTVRFGTAISFALLMISFSIAIVVLFGPRSAFAKAPGFGDTKVRRMELDNSASRCVSRSRGSILNQDSEPAPVPEGASLINDVYRPLSSSVRPLPAAPNTAGRLVLCVLLGLLGAMFSHIAAVTIPGERGRTAWTEWRVAETRSAAGKSVAGLQAISNGLLRAVGWAIVLMTLALSSHALYGAYGLAITTVALGAGGAPGQIGDSLAALAMCAGAVATRQTRRAKYDAPTGSDDDDGWLGVGFETANLAAGMAGLSAVFAAAEQVGVWVSPAAVVGSLTSPPRMMLTRPTGLVQPGVFAAAMLGAAAPALTAGLATRGTASIARTVLATSLPARAAVVGGVESLAIVLSILIGGLSIGLLLGAHAGLAFGMMALATGSTMACAVHGAGAAHSGGRPLRVVTAPALAAGGRLAIVSVLLFAPALRTWSRNGPGAGGVAVLGVGAIVFGLWRRWRVEDEMLRAGRMLAGGNNDGRKSVVSPFYQAGETMAFEEVGPGSVMTESLRMLGSPRKLVSPRELPGVEGGRWIDTVGRSSVPTSRLERSRSVDRDIARHTSCLMPRADENV